MKHWIEIQHTQKRTRTYENLRIMESGSELSKTVATFILQKILLDETGLAYICQTYERFTHVAMILVSKLYMCI